MPAPSAVEENVATPLALRDDVPSCVEPSRKVTVPVGMPAVRDVTVAEIESMVELPLLRAVVVAAFCTFCPTVGDVVGLKFASPP